MNNERLDILFGEIRDEATETSVKEVGKWIAVSAAAIGMFGLLSKFKLPFILTKKLIIMSSIVATIGIGTTLFFLSASATNEKMTAPTAEPQLAKAGVQMTESSPQKDYDVNLATIEPEEKSLEEKIDRIEILPAEKIECVNLDHTIIHPPSETEATPESPGEGIHRSVGYFNKLEVGGTFQVFISQGETESVVLKTDEEMAERILTCVKNEVLEIKFKKSLKNKKGVQICITMTDIRKISASGASQIQSEDLLNAPILTINSDGASSIDIKIRTDDLKINSSGAATLSIEGTTSNLNMDVSGASNISAFDLMANNIDITSSGAANIQCNANGDLIVRATGASQVVYDGTPSDLDTKTSVSSQVSQRR